MFHAPNAEQNDAAVQTYQAVIVEELMQAQIEHECQENWLKDEVEQAQSQHNYYTRELQKVQAELDFQV